MSVILYYAYGKVPSFVCAAETIFVKIFDLAIFGVSARSRNDFQEDFRSLMTP